jgi:hypothetical protein
MSTEIQDVSSVATPPPSAPADSTGVADSSTGTSEESQTATADGVTVQSVIEAKENGVEGTVDPTQDDALEGVPSLEELEQNKSQQYAQALINLRTAYEARKTELAELQGKTAPNPILEKYGDESVITSRLEAYDLLFTPVVNTQGQTEIDQITEFPRVTALPFIERVDTENPGMGDVILWDALNYTVETENGKVPQYQNPIVQQTLLKAWGLDPNRIHDYQNIDALSAPTGVTPEELERVPEDRREAYKTLPSSLRSAWDSIPDDEKAYHLDTAKERLDARRFREQQVEQQRATQEQTRIETQQRVQAEQESFVSQHLQEGNATIMDDLASKVTFTGDAAKDSALMGTVSAVLFSLRDPVYRQANQQRLDAMGVKLGEDFDLALQAADQHLRDAKRYELFGQKGFQQKALRDARDAKNLVLAKLSPIALKIAKAMGGQLAANATEQGKLLTDATRTRPTVGNGSEVSEQGGILPPGIRANSPEADRYLWNRASQG